MPIKKENREVVINFIKKHLGAESVMLFVADSKRPCGDKECTGHTGFFTTTGMTEKAVIDVLQDTVDELKNE